MMHGPINIRFTVYRRNMVCLRYVIVNTVHKGDNKHNNNNNNNNNNSNNVYRAQTHLRWSPNDRLSGREVDETGLVDRRSNTV